jgi:urease accessory protein
MTIEIKSKLKTARRAYKLEVKGQISLPFETRRTGRGGARLVSGEEVALALRGEMLRGGDLLVASDGRVIEVVAEPEAVLQVECESAAQLARAAYLLGERHVPVQAGEGYLRLAADPALAEILKAVATRLSRVHEPFEPDLGAVPEPPEHAHGHDHPHPHHHHHHE